MFILGGKKAAVGVDIGSGSFRAVKLIKGKDKPTLVSIGSIKVPRGAIVGGEIVDVDVVAQSLVDLWKKTGIREKEVVFGIANQKTIVRLIDFPYMEKNELASAIQFQAQDFIPLPIEDVILDYQIIGDYYSDSGDRMLQILLVAAQKGMVETFVTAAEKAGLKPVIIDINAFAAARSLSKTDSKKELRKEEKFSQKIVEETSIKEIAEASVEEKYEELKEKELEESFKGESEDKEEIAEKEDIGEVEEHIEGQIKEEPEQEEQNEEHKDVSREETRTEISEMKTQEQENGNKISVLQEETVKGQSELYDYSEKEGEEPEIVNDGGEETAVESASETISDEGKEVTAIIDVGAGITNIVILEGIKVRFVRIVNIGGDDWTEAIVEMMGISLDEAEDLKVRIGLPPLTGDKYIDVPGDLVDKADMVFSSLEREVIKFIGEIRRSFEYYTSQSGGLEVHEVIVSGGASTLRNFTNYMERGLGVKVTRGNPMAKVEVPPRLKEQLAPGEEGSYSIAIGLALRGLE